MNLRHVALLSLVAISLTSCQTLLQILAAGVQRPVATYKDSKVDAVTFDGATVSATFDVQNPNVVNLDAQGVNWEFSLDGKKVLEGQLAGGLHLVPNGSSPLVVPITVPFSALPDLATTFAEKTEAPYAVQAVVTFRTPMGDLPLPIRWEGVLPVPQLPKVSIGGVKLGAVSLMGAQFVVTLAVVNPNVFALPLEGLTGHITVAGQDVANLGLQASRALTAKGEASVELPVDVSFASAGLAVSSAFLTRSATVGVRGEASFAGRKVPLNLSSTLH